METDTEYKDGQSPAGKDVAKDSAEVCFFICFRIDRIKSSRCALHRSGPVESLIDG